MPAARRDVRGTVWFGRTRPPVVSMQHAATITTSDHVPSNQAFSRATSGLNCLPPQQFAPNPAPREILAQSPWEVYEPRACIYYGRIMVLARHGGNKADLVHIQMQAVERSTIEICVRMIDCLAHCRISRLLNVFQYVERYLLVWESFVFTLFEVQVLECLRFLRDQSRQLASLTPRENLFTKEGELKIAGIENSRQVDTSLAGALNSTFKALRLIVHEIVEEHGSGFSWSEELRAFESALARSTSGQCLDDIMRVS
ncbi:hypothetical protein ASPFODRAFT_213265 [Aspergillus luchuensis CBS 106.47]|uniref:Uncharacterized protein n=1 Tax=Aspergillus luchuensis (strain CBS 106.47) TaxID=1137211 RepID=A0A1M3SYH2_ASPLC|nr:hypothetical protein ASPFODRAFT_213265 [Aspergillus luchuensis CBS 106.47]